MKTFTAMKSMAFAACCMWIAPSAQAAEQDAKGETGARLAWKYHCITCHGIKGISNADRYPKLAGQNVTYIVSRLRYFKQGEEPGNQMNGHAKQLSDADMETLARYFNNPQEKP